MKKDSIFWLTTFYLPFYMNLQRSEKSWYLPLQGDTLESERQDNGDHAEAAAERLHLGRVLLPSPADDATVGQADLGGHDDRHQGRAATEHAWKTTTTVKTNNQIIGLFKNTTATKFCCLKFLKVLMKFERNRVLFKSCPNWSALGNPPWLDLR